jgi:hypothetical protein
MNTSSEKGTFKYPSSPVLRQSILRHRDVIHSTCKKLFSALISECSVTVYVFKIDLYRRITVGRHLAHFFPSRRIVVQEL